MSLSDLSSVNVLVTGAAGFIGREVVAELSKRGCHVIAMVRHQEQAGLFQDAVSVTPVVADITEPATLLEPMRGIDVVIHLAGIVWGNTSSMQGTMVGGTQHLFEAMRQAAVPHLILISSLSVYDWAKVQSPLTESSPVSQDSARKQGPYSQAKTEQELLTRSLCERYGVRLTVVRPGGVVAADNFDAADLGPRIGILQFVVSPRRRLRIVNIKHVADALAMACVADLPDGLIVNLVDDEPITAWELAGRLRDRGVGFHFMLPVPYLFIQGLADLIYPLTRLVRLEKFVPGLLCPSRIACRFKAIRCDTGVWRKYLPLTSIQPVVSLFTDASSVTRTRNLL